MVLVGARKEGESIRYLFQNWWKKKPFVEVDVEYLIDIVLIASYRESKTFSHEEIHIREEDSSISNLLEQKLLLRPWKFLCDNFVYNSAS